MNSVEEIQHSFRTQPDLSDIAVAYSFPRLWGGYYVSDAAQSAYQFEPPNYVSRHEGTSLSDALGAHPVKSFPRFDVALVSQDELKAHRPVKDMPGTGDIPPYALHAFASYHPGGISMFIAFEGTKDTIIQSLRLREETAFEDVLIPHTDTETASPSEMAAECNGIEINDDNYPRFIGTYIESVLTDSVGEHTARWMGYMENHRFKSRIFSLGRISLAGVAMVMVGGYLSKGNFPDSSLLIGTGSGMIIAQTIAGCSIAKKFIDTVDSRQTNISQKSSETARMIAGDIGRTFNQSEGFSGTMVYKNP